MKMFSHSNCSLFAQLPSILIFISVLMSSCKKNEFEQPEDTSAAYAGYELLSSGHEQFYELAAQFNGDEVTALRETGKWIMEQGKAKDVYIRDSSYLYIVMENDTKYGLFIKYVDEDGESIFRGGKGGTEKLALWQQEAGNSPCNNIIPNKKVLLWGAAFPMFSGLRDVLKNSELDFEVTELDKGECTPSSLRSINDYGLVIFDTHGSIEGTQTGITVNFPDKPTTELEFKQDMIASMGEENFNLFKNGELMFSKWVKVPANATSVIWWTDPINSVDSGDYSLWVTPKFIQGIKGLSGTVLFNNSCYSGGTEFDAPLKNVDGSLVSTTNTITIAQAYLNLNPIAYYGWRFDDNTSTLVGDRKARTAEENFINRVAANDSTGLLHLTANGDRISENWKQKELYLTLDKNDDYCYEELCGVFEDPRDGQVYKLACINGQTWFAENLRYETAESYIPNNDPDNLKDYGRLYSWKAVSGGLEWDEAPEGPIKGICPEGWHLPTREDVFKLFPNMSYDNKNYEMQFLKNINGADYKLPKRWTGLDPNSAIFNKTGFSALPAGQAFVSSGSVEFQRQGDRAEFWVSSSLFLYYTEPGKPFEYGTIPTAFFIYNHVNDNKVALDPGIVNSRYFSCRCVKD